MRLTNEQREAAQRVVAYADPPESHFAEWILRLDEPEEPEAERERDETRKSSERVADWKAWEARVVAERDEIKAKLEKTERERDEARNERDAATARMVWAENARGKTLLRLYDVENQAKRVARAERWYGWAWLAHREVWMVLMRSMEERTSLVALNEARDALDAERRKLAEMVGEGDES